MAKKKDSSEDIIKLIRSSKGAKVSSIEIEFEDPEDEEDMKDKVVKSIDKQRSKKK